MVCNECVKLASTYRVTVRAYREAVERTVGSVRGDAVLAGNLAELLHERCLNASEKLIRHVKTQHSAIR